MLGGALWEEGNISPHAEFNIYNDPDALKAVLKSDLDITLILIDTCRSVLVSKAERWQIVQELAKGTSQRDISQNLGVSISKVTRGSRALQYGTGAFKELLDRLGK